MNSARASAAPLAIISKRHPSPDATEVLEMVGDVDGKTGVIVDDMISTGGHAGRGGGAVARARRGRTSTCAATHGIFAGDATQLIDRSPIKRVFVTDTIPLPANGPRDKLEIVTVAPLLAEAIMRIHKDLSISALFTEARRDSGRRRWPQPWIEIGIAAGALVLMALSSAIETFSALVSRSRFAACRTIWTARSLQR